MRLAKDAGTVSWNWNGVLHCNVPRANAFVILLVGQHFEDMYSHFHCVIPRDMLHSPAR